MSGMLVMVGMMDKKECGRKKIFNGIGFKISLDRFKKRCFHIVPLYDRQPLSNGGMVPVNSTGIQH